MLRGPFQSCFIGYWIDERYAGSGYMPDAVALVLRYGFEELGLHRMEAAIVPRNAKSRRVAAKLGLRDEGTAARFLQIQGVWEDHVRYAITREEWDERRAEFEAAVLHADRRRGQRLGLHHRARVAEEVLDVVLVLVRGRRADDALEPSGTARRPRPSPAS